MATYTRTIRGTGERLTIGTAAELGVDATAGKWATICETHSTVANSATQALAYYTRGVDFCDGCRAAQATPKAAAKKPAASTAPIKLAFANGQDIKVHAAGCADLKKAVTKREAFNGIHTQTFPAGTDERDVWVDFNEDFLEGGPEAAWPLEFLPCCHGAGLAKNADRTWEN